MVRKLSQPFRTVTVKKYFVIWCFKIHILNNIILIICGGHISEES